MDWALAFVIGMGTSLVELLSRYRDEPLKVIATSQFAWVYLLLNGLMALGAHAILLDINDAGLTTPTSRAGLAVASGLAAALILRARVFTARLGDEQISIGPGYVVDQLLNIIDAQIDRRRALQRVSIVVEVMAGKDFGGACVHASTMITGSRQNMSLQDQKDLANQIREVVDRNIPDQEKSFALGFILLDFMGEAFLRAVAERLPSAAKAETSGPMFKAASITETGTGVVRSRNWGASLPVQRAKVVRELLTGVPLERARSRTMQLLDSGLLGTSEDERMVVRQQIAQVLGRDIDEGEKVFALGFAVHSLWDSTRFREHYGDLRVSVAASGFEEAEQGRASTKLAAPAPQPSAADDEVDVSLTGLAAEDSGSDRPKTGSHPALKINAGPLPIAKDRSAK